MAYHGNVPPELVKPISTIEQSVYPALKLRISQVVRGKGSYGQVMCLGICSAGRITISFQLGSTRVTLFGIDNKNPLQDNKLTLLGVTAEKTVHAQRMLDKFLGAWMSHSKPAELFEFDPNVSIGGLL